MAEHTKGIWEAIKPAKSGKHWKVGANGVLGGKGPTAGAPVLFFVAMIDNGAPGDTLETEEANARLVAAAPDLLEALKEWVTFADRIMGDLEDGDPLKQAILDTHGARTERSRAALAKAEGRTA